MIFRHAPRFAPVLGALSLLLVACGGGATSVATESAPPEKVTTVPTTLESVLAGTHRADANRARDIYRHPKETLEFFGLAPDMVVVEMWPGRGWYTEVLAPYLRAHGKLTAIVPAPGGAPPQAPQQNTFEAFLGTHPELYDRVEVLGVNPKESPKFGEPGTADLVVTFRNLHNWAAQGGAESMVRAAYDVLRPGGVFGVVDHRAAEGQDMEAAFKAGYVSESYVIELAKNAGFELTASSDVNANPNDTKNYEAGVWTLPPVLRLGEQDRDKYVAIGESDRMTLKFRKP
ncbi:MAG: class I SAM-dependent methyltransferase, partial [Myxococcales bacterium]|nr:class I SAM-dependent methyltransferase [Myxococcales bacterium]